jgi:hypothetical protein
VKVLLCTLFLASSVSASTSELFVVRKSYNEKNVLHYYATVENCAIQSVYARWTMGEQDGHQEGLTFFEKPHFNPKRTGYTAKLLTFTIGALEKMRGKVPDTEISVELHDCHPKAYVEIDHRQVELKEIYVEGTRSGLGFNTKSMSVKGKFANGEAFNRKYLP